MTRLHYRSGSPVLGRRGARRRRRPGRSPRATGAFVGTALADCGIDLDLGPVADVNSNPDNPVIGTRSFGSDPAHVARHVVAWVEGLQSAGVAACLKHYPGHGDTSRGQPPLAARPSTRRSTSWPAASWCRSPRRSRPGRPR